MLNCSHVKLSLHFNLYHFEVHHPSTCSISYLARLLHRRLFVKVDQSNIPIMILMIRFYMHCNGQNTLHNTSILIQLGTRSLLLNIRQFSGSLKSGNHVIELCLHLTALYVHWGYFGKITIIRRFHFGIIFLTYKAIIMQKCRVVFCV